MTSDISYLKLNPAIEQEILNARAKAALHPLYTKDSAVIRREANPNDQASVLRSAFARDIEKIMNVPAYNRYAGKTQVFSLVENDDICRRGLHVQLVSRVGRTIGSALGLNCELIEAIALGHDVGHTPFGHAGERYLNACYHQHTGRYFNHNVHSVRVLDQLYKRNISLQTLDGVLCHNGEFARQKLECGTTSSFEELDSLVASCRDNETHIKHLRPSTLEGCVVRVSDMIAYLGKDRNDAYYVGALSSFKDFTCNVIGTRNTQIIHNISTDIINTSYGGNHIAMSEQVFSDLKKAKEQNFELIYKKEGLNGQTGAAIEEMFHKLYEKLLHDLQTGQENSPVFRHHIASLEKNSRSFNASNYRKTEENQIIVDYIASMTDNYFIALYAHLFPRDKHRIYLRDYCFDLN